MSPSPSSTRILRRSLWPLSFVWAAVSSLRRWAFDTGIKRAESVGVPVLSVGNLSVGGTGKTPTVCYLVERLSREGFSVAVVARGYGRRPGAELNDEGLLLAARFPGLVQAQDPDRVRAARSVEEAGETEVIVLDDGFQHRRIHRDLDIVLLDAERPFAGGLCLPAGDLRETPAGLRRASMIILTRAERIGDVAFASIVGRVRKVARNPELPIFRATHRPVAVRWTQSGPGESEGGWRSVECLRGERVLLLSGIARPEAFERTVRELGAEVVAEEQRPDHHLYEPADLRAVLARAESLDATVLTTEKDAAKLGESSDRFAVLRVDLEFLGPEPSLAQLGLDPESRRERTRVDLADAQSDDAAELLVGERSIEPGHAGSFG